MRGSLFKMQEIVGAGRCGVRGLRHARFAMERWSGREAVRENAVPMRVSVAMVGDGTWLSIRMNTA